MSYETDYEAYEAFSQVYDIFMEDVPYEEWCSYICSVLRSHGIEDGLVLDLGCGTGKMTRLMASAGYDMIGVDLSQDMLMRAMENSGPEILYLNQDMRDFELYGTVRAVISVCDCMNYILSPDELRRVFSLVNNYLDPKGIFIFDMNTLHKYRDILGESSIVGNRDEGSFIWENYFDEDSRINEYDLSLFVREESGLYRKYREIHRQRGYEAEEVKALLERAGLKYIDTKNGYSNEPFNSDSERFCFIAMENGK